jgi:hypothetical protein
MSNDLNSLLTAHFGAGNTEKTAHEVEAQSIAAKEDLFLKAASANGFDVTKMPDDQVLELWNRFYAGEKQASAQPTQEQAAQAEYQAKVAQDNEEARAARFGALMGENVWAAFEKRAFESGMFPPKKEEGKGPPPKGEKKEEDGKDKKEKKDEEKKASQFDAYVHNVALALAKEAGLDAAGVDFGELSERLSASNVLLSAVSPNSKIASAPAGTAFQKIAHIRALELLDFAGVEVNWEGVSWG